MTVRIGINGFGRIGRLALRAGWTHPELEFVQINDPGGDAATFAHLLQFDSVHGQWTGGGDNIMAEDDALTVAGQRIAFTANREIADTDWSGCDVVIEASGKMKTTATLQAYLDQGVKRVVVSAPVKDDGVLNLVVGVNDHLFDPAEHHIVTAASCTTNCLAPVVKVIHEKIGIRHGSMTTIHDITNTQVILDAPHKDLRRARAGAAAVIPTTTGAAKAVALVIPELEGKLDGLALRVPVPTGSITDLVVNVSRDTDTEEVKAAFKAAADGPLSGIMSYMEDPIVSADIVGDPHSCIFDAQITMVKGRQVKVLGWYDNEYGYSARLADMIAYIGERL